MILCVCRNIRESDYDNTSDLLKRLYENDLKCGKCLDYLTSSDYSGILTSSLNGDSYERQESKTTEKVGKLFQEG